MTLRTCHYCGTRVIPTTEGDCPSCRRLIDTNAPNRRDPDVQAKRNEELGPWEPPKVKVPTRAGVHAKQLIIGLLICVGIFLTGMIWEVLVIAGIGMAFGILCLGSLIHSVFTGDEICGLGTTSFYCSSCGEKIASVYVPAQKGITFACPYCGCQLHS